MKTIEKFCRRCKKAFDAPVWRETTKSKIGPKNYCGRYCASRSRERPVAERLLEKVEKTDTCWLWKGGLMGSKDPPEQRYGGIWVNGGQRLVHKIAYKLFVGPIPAGMVVMHSCDVPTCVKPSHLSLGTLKDNSQDMLRKGRGPWQKTA